MVFLTLVFLGSDMKLTRAKTFSGLYSITVFTRFATDLIWKIVVMTKSKEVVDQNLFISFNKHTLKWNVAFKILLLVDHRNIKSNHMTILSNKKFHCRQNSNSQTDKQAKITQIDSFDCTVPDKSPTPQRERRDPQGYEFLAAHW